MTNPDPNLAASKLRQKLRRSIETRKKKVSRATERADAEHAERCRTLIADAHPDALAALGIDEEGRGFVQAFGVTVEISGPVLGGKIK